MIYIIIAVVLYFWRQQILDFIMLYAPRKEEDPLEEFGGLTYRPTIEQRKHLRLIK